MNSVAARFLGHSISSSLAFYLTPRHRTKLQSLLHCTREASVDRLIKWLGSFAIAYPFAGFINCDEKTMIFDFCAAARGTNIVARERQCTIDASMPLAMCVIFFYNGYEATRMAMALMRMPMATTEYIK